MLSFNPWSKSVRDTSVRTRNHRWKPRLEQLEERCVPAVLLQDDFNDNSLDPEKWRVALPAIPGTPAAAELDQHIELLDRGHLVTRQQFDPAQVGPLTIEGTWTFNSSTIAFQQEDAMTIVTRTDGVPAGEPYGEVSKGISFNLRLEQNNPGVMWIADYNGGLNLASAFIPIRNGETFHFRIYDDGLNVTFSVQSAGGLAATISASSPIQNATNYIDFYNGQRSNNPVPHVSYLDNVIVSGSRTDLEATSLTWNSAEAGVDFGYKVSGSDLTQDTTAALYWSSSENFADAIGGPVYSTTIEHPVGDYGPFYVPNSVLGTPPTGATHLLLVTDPPDATHPNGLIDEGVDGEKNNVKVLRIPLDIAVQSAQLIDGNTVRFTYGTTGNPGLFEVGLYHSADGVHYDPADVIATQPVTPSPTNPQTPGSFTLPSDFSAQGKPYLLVVVDPNDLISESNPNNNKASLRLPDVEAVSLNATRLLGNDFLFTYTYRITGSALPADTTVAFYWSDNNTFESDRDTLAFELPIGGFNRAVGEYTRTLVLSKPPGKRYLLVVLDPPTLGGGQGQIKEADETNNVKAVPVGADAPDGPGGDDEDDDPPGAKFPNLEEIFRRRRRIQNPIPPRGLPGWLPRGRPF